MHAIEYSLRWLEINAEAIDRLNVYPVPDGDTGTNMVLTLRAAVREATENPSDNVDVVAANLARGALLGARGNSGVILSQIISRLAPGLHGQPAIGRAEVIFD
ncbi:MAG: DAK2 domain-containing protein, partial [Chloroflexi bacterium]|nr:DAK2 domain-containing protein [Chloroflexota bacterium]